MQSFFAAKTYEILSHAMIVEKQIDHTNHQRRLSPNSKGILDAKTNRSIVTHDPLYRDWHPSTHQHAEYHDHMLQQMDVATADPSSLTSMRLRGCFNTSRRRAGTEAEKRIRANAQEAGNDRRTAQEIESRPE